MPVAVDRQLAVLQRLRDEARNHFLGMLARAVVVERPHDHDRQSVRDVVGVCEPVCTGLRRRIRAPRLERVLLVHRCVVGGAVDLARREEDEALDRRLADRVEEDLRALHVRRHELARALVDRLLHVRFGRGVDDDVDLRDHIADELGIADVSVHERQSLVGHRAREVVEVPGVGQRIE